MNNLFRITKDNVNDIFIEYSKNKQLKQIKNHNIHKTEKKFKKNQKSPKTNNNMNEVDIIKPQIKPQLKSQIKPQINSIIPNFNYEKNIYPQNTHINKNFNCEIKKKSDDNIEKKINITNNNLLVSSDLSNSSNLSNSDNKNKVILEYGKSGIKPDILKKSMSKNLNILAHIDEMIRNFLDCNPKLNLNTLINNNENNVNNENKNLNKKIYHNNSGQIVIENKNNFNIELIGKKSNEEKKYNLVDFGYVKICDISFTEEFINKHKIPSLKSIITFSDNIKHFLKLIKLLEYNNKYKIKINQLSNTGFTDIIYQNLPTIITGISEKKNLFNSADKKFTFYVKIMIEKTMAFIIDKKEKLLYFFNSIETNSSGYIFFYILNIDSKYQIVNLNKISKTSKKTQTNKTNKTNKTSKKIHKTTKSAKNDKIIKRKIVKEKSSSISDFSDSDKFVPIQASLQN